MSHEDILKSVRGVAYVAQKFGYSKRHIRHLCDTGKIVAEKDPDSSLPYERRAWRIVIPSVSEYKAKH